MANTADRNTSRLAFFRRHRWWTATGLTIVILLLLIFFVLPIGVRWGIEKWLESHGRLQAQVQDVDFNLFSGYMVVHSLLAEHEGEGGFKWVRASMEIAWAPLFKKRIRVDDVSVSNARLRIVQEKDGTVYAGGFRVLPAKGAAGSKNGAEQESGWEIGFGNIDLQNVLIELKTPEFERQMAIRKAHVDPMQNWNSSSAGGFTADLAIGDGTLHIEGSAKPYSRNASVQGRMQIRKLPLTWAAPWLKKEDIRNIGGTLQADTAFVYSEGAPTRASMDGKLSLHHITADLPQAGVRPMTLSWDGKVQVVMPASPSSSPRMHADGTLSAQGPAVQLTSTDLAAALQSFRIKGVFQSNTEEVPAQAEFLFTGTAEAENVRVWQPESKTSLARIEKVTTGKLRIAGTQQFQAETAEVHQGGFLELPQQSENKPAQPQYVFSSAGLTVHQVRLEPARRHIDIGAVDVNNARGYLVRDEEGKLRMLERLPTASNAPKTAGNNSTNQTPAWTFAVGHAAVGQKSALRFIDKSVTPAVDLTAANIQFSLENLDSTSTAKVPVHLQAEVGRYGRIDAQGTMVPLAEKISIDINGKVKQFGLPQLRGYVRQKLGYTIQSGQLYADFHLLILQDRMDSLIKLFITELNLNRLSQNELSPMEQQLGMPLNTALKLVRDGKGDIRLRLPVTGSLAKPDVQIGSVIGTAVRKALYTGIKTAALGFFAPLGAAYVAGKIFGKVVALRLNPIDFAAGQVQLGPKGKDYLGKVAAKLKDRPETRLLICGKAAPGDRQALRQAKIEKNRSEKKQSTGKKKNKGSQAMVSDAELLKLAKTRAENARTYLVNQGIASGRLVVCAPRIDTAENAKPQVELAV